MSRRRRTHARPGRKKGGNRCAGCGKLLYTYKESYCISCDVKKAAREALFGSTGKQEKKEEEKKMNIPKMGKE